MFPPRKQASIPPHLNLSRRLKSVCRPPTTWQSSHTCPLMVSSAAGFPVHLRVHGPRPCVCMCDRNLLCVRIGRQCTHRGKMCRSACMQSRIPTAFFLVTANDRSTTARYTRSRVETVKKTCISADCGAGILRVQRCLSRVCVLFRSWIKEKKGVFGFRFIARQKRPSSRRPILPLLL